MGISPDRYPHDPHQVAHLRVCLEEAIEALDAHDHPEQVATTAVVEAWLARTKRPRDEPDLAPTWFILNPGVDHLVGPIVRNHLGHPDVELTTLGIFAHGLDRLRQVDPTAPARLLGYLAERFPAPPPAP